jgi:hypothetical protein
LVTKAVKFKACPSTNPLRFGVIVTLTGPATPTVMVAVAVFVVSVTEVAVNLTVAGFGTFTGAVYVTAAPDALDVGVTAPHVAPLQPVPDSVQLTPLFAESFATLAVKLVFPPTTTLAAVCDRLIVIASGIAVIVIPAVPTFVPSATEVAVSTTTAGLGTLPGAMYVSAAPDALLAAETVPHVTPLHPAPDRVQVTPLFELSWATVAENDWLWPTGTDEVAGDTATEIGSAPVACRGAEVPVQPPSHATVTIANKSLGVCPACACLNAGLPFFALQIV